MKKVCNQFCISVWMFLLSIQVSFSQSPLEDKAEQEFDNLAGFMVNVMTGPASKILALLFLIVGIWKIIHKDYGSAIGCVLALLALVFMPNFLKIF